MIQQDILTLLTSSSALNTLVGTRIYPVVIPTGSALPCVTFSVTSSVPVDGHSLDMQAMTRMRVSVDVFSTSYLEAHTTAQAVRAALDGYTGGDIQLIYIENVQDFYMSDAEIYRVALELFVFTTAA